MSFEPVSWYAIEDDISQSTSPPAVRRAESECDERSFTRALRGLTISTTSVVQHRY